LEESIENCQIVNDAGLYLVGALANSRLARTGLTAILNRDQQCGRDFERIDTATQQVFDCANR